MTALNTPRYRPMVDTLTVSFEIADYQIESPNSFVDIYRHPDMRVIGFSVWQVSMIISDAEAAAANYVPDPETEGMTLEELIAHVAKKNEGKEFTPAVPSYFPEQDRLWIYFENAPDHSKQKCDYVAHLLAFDDNRIVGVEIHGVKKLIKKARN